MGRSALRTCRTCGLEAHTKENLELFVKRKYCRHGREQFCKDCQNRLQREDWQNNPLNSRKAYQLAKRYQCTPEEYVNAMASSDFCGICGTKENLCYDHCHDTMDFRGVLCRSCNRAIGALGDTAEGVQKALNYLNKARKPHEES
jgi:hypothetical protein